MGYRDRVPFSTLVGKTLTEVRGLDNGSDRVVFVCADGSEYTMDHRQDCCERVEIEDVTGNVVDLIGSPITMADESSNSDDPPARVDDAFEWTFYKLATIKGYVDIRWLGTSNGYYSTSVDFEQTKG